MIKRHKSINYRGLYLLIFLAAIGLRSSLALVNLAANDPHFEVVKIILDQRRIPETGEVWEGYQPKLYHVTTAALLKVLPFKSFVSQVKVAQFVNVIAGSITVYYVFLLMSSLPFADKTKFLVLALVALNPKFIGINAQASNDTFVILFSTLTLYYAILYFRGYRLKDLSLMSCFCILAGLSKGNGLVVFVVIVLSWVINLFRIRSVETSIVIRTFLASFGVFLLAYASVVPLCGQYVEKVNKYGSPLVIPFPKQPAPHFIERTFVARPGVTSIVDSYLTFRFFDLIKTPIISSQSSDLPYPLHRTSLWTQLYGRAHFVHFDQWPQAWQTDDPAILNVGRIIFLLALLPTAFMVVGITRNTFRLFTHSARSTVSYSDLWIYLLGMAGYLGFIVLFSFEYRDFAYMKVIFIFPAFLCFGYFLADGMDYYYKSIKSEVFLRLSDISLAALLILYCVDILYLIRQLA